jgi:Kef-type K+ transport system membrane component KefB
MRVELAAITSASALGLALLLFIAAVLGKQLCALGTLGSPLDGLTIGLGMIPRGEVGLIFASIGLGLSVRGERIVDPAIYSAVVLMVLATTLVTPPALAWSISRRTRRRLEASGAGGGPPG